MVMENVTWDYRANIKNAHGEAEEEAGGVDLAGPAFHPNHGEPEGHQGTHSLGPPSALLQKVGKAP